jgi:hypothetical protein
MIVHDLNLVGKARGGVLRSDPNVTMMSFF